MRTSRTTLAGRAGAGVGRLAAIFGLAGGMLGLGGCSSLSVQRDLATIVTMAPATVLVQRGEELRAAEAAAQTIKGAKAFRGVDQSMKSLYGTGTAIVVMPCDYARLRAGMSVVYVNHGGRGVAHVIINEMPDGWIAQGVDNPEEDPDLVTPANLVGVITRAYASADATPSRVLARR